MTIRVLGRVMLLGFLFSGCVEEPKTECPNPPSDNASGAVGEGAAAPTGVIAAGEGGTGADVAAGGAGGGALEAETVGGSSEPEESTKPIPAAECIHVPPGTVFSLLDQQHTLRALPSATLSANDGPGFISMRGTLEREARLELTFARCLDLSALAGITFEMVGRDGDVIVALDSPTNARPPQGTCEGKYCYSPRSRESLELGKLSAQSSWSDFTNGAPAASSDPEHVIGVSFSVSGSPGTPVDLRIERLMAETLE